MGKSSQKKGECNKSSMCSMLGVEDELVEHFFSGCTIVGKVWERRINWAGIANVNHNDEKNCLLHDLTI